MVTIYSTPTCHRCRLAKRRLTDAGVPVTTVDLLDTPAQVDRLKELLGTPILDLPVIETADGVVTQGFLPDRLRSIVAAHQG